jgi:integrase
MSKNRTEQIQSANLEVETHNSNQSKAKKNSISIESRAGFLRLNFPRQWSRKIFNVNQKRISLGLSDTPSNRFWANQLIAQLKFDYLSNQFDKTLVKYNLTKPELTVSSTEQKLTLLELWLKYSSYRKSSLSETTYQRDYLGRYKRILEKCNSNNPLDIHKYLTENCGVSTAQRMLANLERAVDWGLKSEGIIPPYDGHKNPFVGMARELQSTNKKPKPKQGLLVEEDWSLPLFRKCKAFTVEERDIILQAWHDSPHNYYYSFLLFKFMTGCRTGEAIALRWKHILFDSGQIHFCETFNHSLKITKCTKTGKSRFFPLFDPKLIDLLLSLKSSSTQPNDLVFPSPTGKHISCTEFDMMWGGSSSRSRRYPGIVIQLVNERKIRSYLNPYATRHTFITLQIHVGNISPHVVAEWVGNSAEAIFKHYCDVPPSIKPANI